MPGTTFPAADDGTGVGDDTVALWIAEADAEVNGKLAGRYTLPITGTESLLIMKSIVIALVVWRIAKALDQKNERTLPTGGFGQPVMMAQQAPNVSQAKTTAFARLMGIAQGTERLRDAVEIAGIYDVGVATNIEPLFTRDTPAW